MAGKMSTRAESMTVPSGSDGQLKMELCDLSRFGGGGSTFVGVDVGLRTGVAVRDVGVAVVLVGVAVGTGVEGVRVGVAVGNGGADRWYTAVCPLPQFSVSCVEETVKEQMPELPFADRRKWLGSTTCHCPLPRE